MAPILSIVYSGVYGLLAYLLPAYQTFKAIEKRTPDVTEWAQYWVVLSSLYCTQFIIDFLLSWLPFYSLAKLFFLYALWASNFRFAAAIYAKVFAPLLSSYEADIDRTYVEVTNKIGDMAGQQTENLKVVTKDLAGRATVALKQVQQKALARNKPAAPAGVDAPNGLHTE